MHETNFCTVVVVFIKADLGGCVSLMIFIDLGANLLDLRNKDFIIISRAIS